MSSTAEYPLGFIPTRFATAKTFQILQRNCISKRAIQRVQSLYFFQNRKTGCFEEFD